VDGINYVLASTCRRYTKYYRFGKIDDLEYKTVMRVLSEIEDEIDGILEEEEDYDGEE
jgi:hypothetical protein